MHRTLVGKIYHHIQCDLIDKGRWLGLGLCRVTALKAYLALSGQTTLDHHFGHECKVWAWALAQLHVDT